jgi:hypothetical protein
MFLLGPNTFAEGNTRIAQQDASITSRGSAAGGAG